MYIQYISKSYNLNYQSSDEYDPIGSEEMKKGLGAGRGQ